MHLKTNLFSQQLAAVEKVLPSRIGALFMEMGTGKSRTAIELVHRRDGKLDKVLWFCPVTLKETVRREILKHTDATDTDIHVFDGKTSENRLPDCLWYVIGIESVSSSARVLLTVNKMVTDKTMIIVDESDYIKGHRSKRSERLTRLALNARYRLIMTGTPLSQGVVDLYSQMRFLSPDILGYRSFYSFAGNHLEYHEKYKGLIVQSHNVDYLAAKIAPYTYQVKKSDCMDLPKKLYKSYYFSMTREQEIAYEDAKITAYQKMENRFQDSYIIFELFTELQQITCGFLHEMQFQHYRLDTLEQIINSIPEKEKIIIWCKYVHDIKTIHEMLKSNFSDEVALYYGELNEKARIKEEDKFHGNARFFLSTMSCGGHGLTLNEASYVIYYNNSFKYSERLQTEDRNHRIGQCRSVTYIDIVCEKSIDIRISNAIANKEDTVQSFKREVDKIKDSGEKKEKYMEL